MVNEENKSGFPNPDLQIVARLKAKAAEFTYPYMQETTRGGRVAIAFTDDDECTIARTLNMRLICPYEIVVAGGANTSDHVLHVVDYYLNHVMAGNATVLSARDWVRPTTDSEFEYRLTEVPEDDHPLAWVAHKNNVGEFTGLDVIVRKYKPAD